MKIIKTKINTKDERGIIKDILTNVSIDAITYITTNKGGVRGNHYHEKTHQYEYVLKGSFLARSKMGEDGKIEEYVLKVGDMAYHPPFERHAFKALEDSEFLSFTHGPRRGDDYESDVIRLTDNPLIPLK